MRARGLETDWDFTLKILPRHQTAAFETDAHCQLNNLCLTSFITRDFTRMCTTFSKVISNRAFRVACVGFRVELCETNTWKRA